MTYVVTENCINCKFQDCVAVCPVDCFYEGENFLVIHPDECIDCGVCEPECPAHAIKAETEPNVDQWLAINAKYAQIWPNITEIGTVRPDADEWNGKPNKAALLITGDEPADPRSHKPVYDPGDAPNQAIRSGFEIDGAKLALPRSDEGTQSAAPKKRAAEKDTGFEVDGLRFESNAHPTSADD